MRSICFAIACACACVPESGRASELLSTAYFPSPSMLTVDFFLGEPSPSTFLGTLGPVQLDGYSNVDLNLDAAGSGTMTFLNSQYTFADLLGTLDLGAFGSVDYDFSNFGFNCTTDAKTVTAHSFAFDFDESVDLTWNQGTVNIFNPQGPIAVLASDSFPQSFNFWNDPFTVFQGVVSGPPLAGLTVGDELGMQITDLSSLLFDFDAFDIYVRLNGQMKIAGSPPNAQVVKNLATGFDDMLSSQLPDGVPDSDYRFGTGSVAEFQGTTPVTTDDFVAGPWIPEAESLASRWIVPSDEAGADSTFAPPGTYFFETDIDLAGLDADKVSIRGLRYASDDRLERVLLNGIEIYENPSDSLGEFSDFRNLPDFLGFGLFQAGVNTLRFEVSNFDTDINPVGLRVEGYVEAVPEPATYVLGLTGAALLCAIRWRARAIVGRAGRR